MYIKQSHMQFAQANLQPKKYIRACVSAVTNFAEPQERIAENRPTFGTLSFAQHTNQRRKSQRAKFMLITALTSTF